MKVEIVSPLLKEDDDENDHLDASKIPKGKGSSSKKELREDDSDSSDSQQCSK